MHRAAWNSAFVAGFDSALEWFMAWLSNHAVNESPLPEGEAG